MKYCLFLLIFCSIIEAKAEDSNNPYDILLDVFSHKLNRSLNDCNLYLIPLVDEQMKIKKEITTQDLFKFGVMTSESGFNQIESIKNCLLDKRYCEIISTKNFDEFNQVSAIDIANPWLLSMHPLVELRKIAFFSNKLSNDLGLKTMDDLFNYLSNIKAHDFAVLSSEQVQVIKKTFARGVQKI